MDFETRLAGFQHDVRVAPGGTLAAVAVTGSRW